ncbi:hypothetical protein H5410_031330 [Solanum commersonii]|uniref:Uncharacterized protein n=1 Tax=Solanum commersonii TaxID=4109 RepID=A0A9J5YJW1_SOLCO|nr:hypothetical protein H5410_031330 [Solanum commersonii]
MAKAYRKEDFDKLMTKVVKVDHRVKVYLEDVGYEKWSRVHLPVNRGRMMTSNIAECINGCLVEARQLPILVFSERLFHRLNIFSQFIKLEEDTLYALSGKYVVVEDFN